jgi:hypothetical protein
MSRLAPAGRVSEGTKEVRSFPHPRGGYRKIEGLRYAALSERPPGLPRTRPRGTKALGLRFERALARALPGAKHGQWFYFVDRNGPGYCQPDLYLDSGGYIVVFEAKLTDCAQAKGQILDLYAPVLAKALGKPVQGIIVVRHLTQVSDLTEVRPSLALARIAARTSVPILHWLGRGPL